MADEKELILEVRERLVKIETMIENMSKTNDLKLLAMEEKMEEKIKVANNRIKDLEDNNRWLWRAFAGALIAAAITFLINYK
jgi:hypothetical protein